jgi:hypothetical protein
MLDSALRHKLHIQIHGCSKFSGEQRTFPHLFNREGVLNLEYVKWSNLCTPAGPTRILGKIGTLSETLLRGGSATISCLLDITLSVSGLARSLPGERNDATNCWR